MLIPRERALAAIRTLLLYAGEDPSRPGLIDTPERVLRAWEEDWGRGYSEDASFLVKTFQEEQPGMSHWGSLYNQMIVVKDIAVYSHCEHHLTPFFGVAHLAYIPSSDIGLLGLSKFARIVDHFARRLQVQERLTQQIANFVTDNVSPDCAVMIKAKHLCMISRGVCQPNAETETTALRGRFYDEDTTRSEFLQACRSQA